MNNADEALVETGQTAPPSDDGEAVLEALSRLARDVLDHHPPLARPQRLVEDLELDSIRLLSLATAVEDHFRIMLDEDDEARIETVGDLVDLVQSKAREESSPIEGPATAPSTTRAGEAEP